MSKAPFKRDSPHHHTDSNSALKTKITDGEVVLISSSLSWSFSVYPSSETFVAGNNSLGHADRLIFPPFLAQHNMISIMYTLSNSIGKQLIAAEKFHRTSIIYSFLCPIVAVQRTRQRNTSSTLKHFRLDIDHAADHSNQDEDTDKHKQHQTEEASTHLHQKHHVPHPRPSLHYQRTRI